MEKSKKEKEKEKKDSRGVFVFVFFKPQPFPYQVIAAYTLHHPPFPFSSSSFVSVSRPLPVHDHQQSRHPTTLNAFAAAEDTVNANRPSGVESLDDSLVQHSLPPIRWGNFHSLLARSGQVNKSQVSDLS